MIRIYGGIIEEDIKIFICKAVNGGHCRSEWRYVCKKILNRTKDKTKRERII